MWRIINIGRGLRSVRPSQCCPQDCSDETSSHHLQNDEVSKIYTATLRHCSAASSWSPLAVTRSNNFLKQVSFGLTKPKDIHTRSHDNVDPGADGTSNRYHHQRCPPWHWHVLQEDMSSEEQEKRKEKESKDDEGNTWHYQEWKEILQASPTLHTIGLGSAAALTLSLYRNWSDLYPYPRLAKDERKPTHNGANKIDNLKNNLPEEYSQNNEDLLWRNCKTFKNFFNSEVHSQEIPDTLDKDSSKVQHEVPSLSGNIVIYKPDINIKSAKNEAHGSTVPVYSLQRKSLDLIATFFNIQGNVKKKHKQEEYDVILEDVSESLLSLQSEKDNETKRSDSRCMYDLPRDFQSLSATNSGLYKNQCNGNEKNNTNRTVSAINTERPVSRESEFQAEVKDVRSEHTQESRTSKEPEESCDDDSKMKVLHKRLFEMVKANREDQLQEVVKKDGNPFSDTVTEEAIISFQAGVMAGDPSSGFNLALCYHMGYGITQDLKKARKLYEGAAAAGHGWAIYNLAVMVSQGLGGPCLPQRAHSLLQQAASMGITEAVQALSVLEMEKQKDSITYEEPQLQKCHSEKSLSSSLTNHRRSSHSTGDLQFLLDENSWADSDLSSSICKIY